LEVFGLDAPFESPSWHPAPNAQPNTQFLRQYGQIIHVVPFVLRLDLGALKRSVGPCKPDLHRRL
jgi:hypothetical protein